jgi:RND family efflux transporter MFP subunit
MLRTSISSHPIAGHRFVSLAAVVAGALAFVACAGPEPAPPGEAPMRLEATLRTAQVETHPRMLVAAGTVEPSRRTSPGTKILGRVAAIAVREGERVEAGQTLARFEDRDLRAALDGARAAVTMAEAQLENAGAQLARMQGLHARGSVTEKNLEDAVAAERVARAGLDQARAGLSSAEVMLSYAEVASPFAGWVTAKHTEVGDLVAPGQPMFTIEDLDPVKVVVNVPEGEVRHVEPGARAHLEVTASGDELEAVVDRVVPTGDRRARTFEVQLAVPNPEGRLKSGMFARASFELGTTEAIWVPAEALVERGQLQGVFIVDEHGHARLRWVRTGEARDGAIEILSGLAGGERYVAEPPMRLVDGAIIEGAVRDEVTP